MVSGEPLKFPAVFEPELNSMDFAYHDIEIKDEDGTTLFTQKDVEAPVGWSERAVRVAASKYLYGDPSKGDDPSKGGREPSIIDLHLRVANFIAEHGAIQGLYGPNQVEPFRNEIVALTLGQYGAFNSPVWFNVGLDSYGVKSRDRAYFWDPGDGDGGGVLATRDVYLHPQGSACFIQSVADDMESLMALARNEAMLFKHGSGTGTDFSPIRSSREKLSNGGKPSGPISFMSVYDQIAAVVKSGGKTRRAAKMQTLGVWHPDILNFIRVKGREEKKAHALIRQGYDSNFNGEAYSSVKFQNANFSVRITRAFMTALEHILNHGEGGTSNNIWPLRAVTTGEAIEWVDPLDIWNAVAEETHRCGDPGVQFSDTINAWHTCPNTSPINSSNPCSEYLFIDDSACNLASLNLMKFVRPDGTVDIERLKAAVRTFIVAQEILVDACSYPTERIARNSHDYRTLGLGFANLGGLLQSSGVAYDSDEGRTIAGALAAIIGGESYAVSGEIAGWAGPFAGFAKNREPMLRVIRKHADAAKALWRGCKDWSGGALVGQIPELCFEAEVCWEYAILNGEDFGYRHAQVTVIAPTGTIAFMMDCDTTGIEPNLALVAVKTLAGGGSMPVVNRLVSQSLRTLGYTGGNLAYIEDYIRHNGTAENCPLLKPEHVPVFDSSFSPPGFSRTLRWQAHLLMMSAVQPFVSGAISKTVNMPSSATVDTISECYREAERLGIKCVAIYRDGSKWSQPLTAKGQNEPAEDPEEGPLLEGRRVECGHCGSMNVVPNGTCGLCHECGTTTGCS